ncbi:MAG: hypothetical protein AAF493_16290 [Pseudomonadota bacterium]
MSAVPRSVVIALVLALGVHIAYVVYSPRPIAEAKSLRSPPDIENLRPLTLGDPIVASKLLTLWLQAFDNQPGVSVPFKSLDYARVEDWLERILALDPRARYPLLVAARVYAVVPDPARQRIMLDFVYRKFLEHPNARWRWLAHASLVAKHRLEDLPLALRYAEAIRTHVTSEIPFWARDMSIIILQEMGEVEAAKILVAGLLEAGTITDPAELRFLEGRLAELEQALGESGIGRDGD